MVVAPTSQARSSESLTSESVPFFRGEQPGFCRCFRCRVCSCGAEPGLCPQVHGAEFVDGSSAIPALACPRTVPVIHGSAWARKSSCSEDGNSASPDSSKNVLSNVIIQTPSHHSDTAFRGAPQRDMGGPGQWSPDLPIARGRATFPDIPRCA